MSGSHTKFPPLFKGIALFTPGGDLIYCIDPSKRRRWHIHLCAALQEMLGLSEPPHFLVPCYTATLDQWLDPSTGEIKRSAEAYAPVWRYRSLLNAIFDTEDLIWQPASPSEALCSPVVVASYYQQFPQLWDNHDLVVQLQQGEHSKDSAPSLTPKTGQSPHVPTAELRHRPRPNAQGYVLRLFISGHSLATERTLETLHQLLERSTRYPYTLKVIDVLKHPEQAEADHISATPTLMKVWPEPVRRIVGELNDISTILRLLEPLEKGESNSI